MANVVLDVKNLTKQYGSFTAVDEISFQLHEGEVLGLLGPNGAGKTTTMQMLLGLTTPTTGSIFYFGMDFSQRREECLARVNFTSAYSHVQARLTVWQNLRVFGGLYEIVDVEKRIRELAELLGIEDVLNLLFWKLSSGQKSRVNLAKSLLNKPKLILMDEPTASLDPEIVNRVIDLIAQMQEKEGVAILLTSHNMVEVARVCDRVAFLDHGKIVTEDTPLGLSKMIGEAGLQLTFDGPFERVKKYLEEKKFVHKKIRAQIVEVTLREESIPKILMGLSKRDVWITDVEIKKPDLEDVFLSIARGHHVMA